MGNPIEVHDLSLSYTWKHDSKLIFKDLNFSVGSGAFVTVVGGNGSGKSSLIKLILGLLKPDSGTILLNGKAVCPGYPTAVREGRVAYLAQQIEELFLADTVGDELLHGVDQSTESQQDVLNSLGLLSLLERPIETLSGGERQALALGQFISQEAPILILDEPSSYFDRDKAHVLHQHLVEAHTAGKTILHVTQYPAEVAWGSHVLDLNMDEPEVLSL